MARNIWSRIDYWMRLIHLYTGLLLVPWMFVYALSAFSLNHHTLVAQYLGVKPPTWQRIKQVEFTVPDSFPKARNARAKAILDYLNLDGPHLIPRQQRPGQLVILRFSGAGNWRITWLIRAHKIRLERQTPFSTLRLVNFLHFRCGFGQPYTSFRAWAVIVDVVAACMAFWSISGVYIWIRQRNRRAWGTVFFVGGLVLFGVLVYSLL